MACTKYRYRSRLDALLAIADMRRRGNRDRHPQRAYHCTACRAWHITSMARADARPATPR